MPIQRTDTLIDEDNLIKNSISNSNSKADAWGRLVPISQNLGTYDLLSAQTVIGRNIQCAIQIKQQRLSNRHCIITKSQKQVSITDVSSNGTFINHSKVGKGHTIKLKDNDEIWLLPLNKVRLDVTMGFRIEFMFERREKQEEERKNKQEEEKQREQKEKEKQKEMEKLKEEEKKKQEELKKANNLAKSIKDQITCAFCFEIMYIPVNVQPCNHRFCGACLTQLIQAKKEQCIQCRKDIKTAVRDSIFNSIVEDYLKSHPDEKRSDKQEEEARKKNIFGHDPVDVEEKIHGKKKAPTKTKAVVNNPPTGSSRRGRGRGLMRTTSDLSASDDDDAPKCRECTHPRDGFQCTSTQIHMQCHTCAKLMPNRDDPSLHQFCVICTTNFCNLYFPPCARSGVKLDLIKNKKQGVKIDAQLLRGNKFEYDAIKNYLLSKKQNSKDVFDFMLQEIRKKKFSYLFDKKLMKIPPMVSKQVKLQQDSAVCDLCWKDLWFQMVFAYKNTKISQFPEAVRNRPVCYWGVNCRTMDHNQDHAKRYNHLIFQTRFS